MGGTRTNIRRASHPTFAREAAPMLEFHSYREASRAFPGASP